MIEATKGRPPLPESEKLHYTRVGYTQAQLEKIKRNGGYSWLRNLINRAPEKKRGAA